MFSKEEKYVILPDSDMNNINVTIGIQILNIHLTNKCYNFNGMTDEEG